MAISSRLLVFVCFVPLAACASTGEAPNAKPEESGGAGVRTSDAGGARTAQTETDSNQGRTLAAAGEDGGSPTEAAVRVGSPSSEREAGSYSMSNWELNLWNDPAFKRRFIESYVAATDVEPSVTTIERDQLSQIFDNIANDRRDKAVRLLEKYGVDSASAVFDFTLASMYLEQEDAERAITLYSKAVAKYPNFRRAWRNMGLAHVRLSQFDGAIKAFTRVIELGGDDAITYGSLGFAYANVSNWLAAESAYRMAAMLDPVTVDWKMHLARSLLSQERFADAASLFSTLISEFPDRADLWMFQGIAYIGLNQPMKAAENYEMVDKLGGSTADTLNMLGDVYVNEALYEPAIDCYARAMALDVEGDSARVIRAAKALSARGAHDETAWLLAELARIRGDRISTDEKKEVLRLQAKLALVKGGGEEEVEILRELVSLDPLDGGALILLAQHSARNADHEQAIFYFERAAAIEEFEAEAKTRHAQVLVGLKRYSEAIPLLRRAQHLDPRDSVQDYLEQIERLSKNR